VLKDNLVVYYRILVKKVDVGLAYMRGQRLINTDPKDMEYDFGIRVPAVRYNQCSCSLTNTGRYPFFIETGGWCGWDI
jgi:hypothetical protein